MQDQQNRIRVLFIGNSYIYFNNLPELLVELSAREARPVVAEMVVEGGATLAKLWNDGNALAALRRDHWDYVVLQEQSTLGAGAVVNGIEQINDPADFFQAASRFDDAIQQIGAKTLLYLTWARQYSPEKQAELIDAYTTVAHDRHAQVAPVGTAWMSALAAKPELPFYWDDGSHPQPAGSYLAACVFYATLYQKSPEGLPEQLTITPVSDEGEYQPEQVTLVYPEALFLQQIAWQVVSRQSFVT